MGPERGMPMKTVHEVSRLTGVSIRALQYYDRIGLLRPAERSEAGYRLYDDSSLERLQQILLFRELEFPLQEIRRILDSPDFDRTRAMEQQITLLRMKQEHLQKLIDLAQNIKTKGGNPMDFTAFDRTKLEKYAEDAKKTWGDTQAYREYEEKARSRSDRDEGVIAEGLMELFRGFGALRGGDPASAEAQAQVAALQDYISANYYNCTPEILSGLGRMYAAGGEFTENIDRCGGEGTARFVNEAIRAYV